MRTFEQISADVGAATNINNAATLMRLATELDELATPEATALAHRARGWACYCTGDYPAALEHYNSALVLYHELGNRSGVATVTGNIGVVSDSTGDYPAALEHFNSALALHHELGYRSGVATVTNSIGNVYYNAGDYPAALEHFNSALVLFHELGNRSGVASVTGNIGIVYNDTGDYPAALEHYNSALALHNELGNRSGVASVTGNIGIVYDITGDYPAALEHFNSALALHHELGNRRGVARATGNIGNVYGSTGNYPAALEHFNSALALFHELGNRSGVAGVTGNILLALLSTDDVDGARRTLTTLDELPVDNPRVAIEREMRRAEIHVLDGDLQAAHTTLTNALELAVSHGLRAKQADVYKELRNLAQQRNDFAAYIEHNNEFTRINEEILGKETSIKMAIQAKEREIAEKDKETAKHMAVLHSTLPKHIADRVARGEVVNDHYDNAAVLFLDIVGFTTLSSEMDVTEVIALLDRVFATCDTVVNKHNMMKIKTIGDSYMAASFDNVESAALAALDLVASITQVQVRIGIHCGPVVAGVLGKERMQYDVWGDTVNIASRMESTSEPGRIHISSGFALTLHGETAKQRNGEQEFCTVVERGEIEIKGKGMMTTHWLQQS